MRSRQRGLALVIVLWISLLLALLAASYAFGVRTESRVVAGVKERAEARALAEAAVHFVSLVSIEWEPDDWPFKLNGEPFTWSFGERDVSVRVNAAGGRVDLNRAGDEVLSLALRSAGLPEQQVDSVADAIMDWRDRDDARRVNGAEAPDYARAGVEPGPKDGPFESVDEFGQVLGVDAALVDRLRPLLTVYGAETIDPRYAPKEVLLVLAGGDEALVDALIAGDNADVTQKLPWAGFGTGGIANLHLDIEVSASTGSRHRFAAVVAPEEVALMPPILEWRE